MRSFVFLIVGLVFVPPASAVAQVSPPIRRGEQVRIIAPECWSGVKVGRFDKVRNDSILAASADSRVECPLESVLLLEKKRGAGPFTTGTAIVGGCVFGVLGALTAATDGSGCRISCDITVLGVAATGAALGWLLGRAMESTGWNEVPVDRLRVDVVPRQDGVGFGMVLRF